MHRIKGTTDLMSDARPTDREVLAALHAAIIAAHDTLQMYRAFPMDTLIPMVARRFLGQFPAFATADQIQRAIVADVSNPHGALEQVEARHV